MESHLMKCTKCGRSKDRGAFSPDKKRKGGLRSWCRQCCREAYRRRRMKDPEKERRRCRLWWEKNNYCERRRIGRQSDLGFRLGNSFGTLIRRRLSTTGKGVWVLLGYSADDLMVHLEKQFEDGMSWDNYGQWEVDHIIPRHFFKYNNHKDAEFEMCWRLENLRPLWKSENRKREYELRKIA